MRSRQIVHLAVMGALPSIFLRRQIVKLVSERWRSPLPGE
jgi:hypothetical protein